MNFRKLFQFWKFEQGVKVKRFVMAAGNCEREKEIGLVKNAKRSKNYVF